MCHSFQQHLVLAEVEKMLLYLVAAGSDSDRAWQFKPDTSMYPACPTT